MISDRHRCIFVHVPRTGGSSLENVIWPKPRAESDLWMGFVSPMKNKYQTGGLQHLYARNIVKEVGRERFDTYFKFSIVRNPFDRLVSQYHYMSNREDLRKYIGMEEMDSFSRYLSLIVNYEHVQWTPQVEFLLDEGGRLAVDRLLRYETYEADVRDILARLNIPIGKLPHANSTVRSAYPGYYSKADREIAERLFTRDLSYFNYNF